MASRTVPPDRRDLPITPIVRSPAGEAKLQKYADRVTRRFAKSVKEIILSGQELLAAKRELRHGEFERLFRDHPHPVKKPIPITARYGRMLMAIAAHPIVSKQEHCSDLPTAVRTLYALAAEPASAINKAFAAGEIHPQLELREVQELFRRGPEPPRRPHGALRAGRQTRDREREVSQVLRNCGCSSSPRWRCWRGRQDRRA